ncbi:MAG: hypothetical protein U1E76_28710 [Planctomycetota bacterium]
MSWRGRVVRKRLAAGSKSECEGLVLVTSAGEQLKLRRLGGNPFRDAELEPLVGHEIECEGALRNGQIIMTSWTVVG